MWCVGRVGQPPNWISAGRPEDRPCPLSRLFTFTTHPPIAPTCHVDSPQTYRSCRSYPVLLHDRSPPLILRLFSKTRLSARSCTRAYATTSAPRRGMPPSPTSQFFSFTSDIFRSRPHPGSLFEGTQVVQGPSRRKSHRIYVLSRAHRHVCG